MLLKICTYDTDHYAYSTEKISSRFSCNTLELLENHEHIFSDSGKSHEQINAEKFYRGGKSCTKEVMSFHLPKQSCLFIFSELTGVRGGDLFMSFKTLFKDVRAAMDWVHIKVRVRAYLSP